MDVNLGGYDQRYPQNSGIVGDEWQAQVMVGQYELATHVIYLLDFAQWLSKAEGRTPSDTTPQINCAGVSAKLTLSRTTYHIRQFHAFAA